MQILECGREHRETLLFFPCTAEPVWAFADTIAVLSQRWHIFQVVFDGHQPEYPGDFTSVEQTVDEVIAELKARSVTRLDAAYGCSLGGACLTRLLALGELPVGRAIIDAGITPYQLPLLARGAICLADWAGFQLLAGNRRLLEMAYPPERWTLPGRDPVKEYDALEAYLKTYSSRSVRNIFWSANNYALPKKPAQTPCRIIYWYGDEEKKARHGNIRFIKRYFPHARMRGIPKMEHAELVMLHPQEFYRRAMEFYTHTPRGKTAETQTEAQTETK